MIIQLVAHAVALFASVASLQKLSSEQELVIRNSVFAGGPRLSSPDFNSEDVFASYRTVLVPKELVGLHKRNPRAVLSLLVRIADGASADDSITAITYALALIQPNGGGVVAIENYKKSTYDTVEKGWANTPRYHWIDKMKTKATLLK